jgi:hypothetical protein
MNTIRRLGAAVVLTLVLGLSVFAGEISTPPCAPPDPGEISTPPCVTQMASDLPTTLGQIPTLPASNPIDMPSVAALAMDLMLLF